jgi:ribosomal protein L37AE/L43A
MQNAAASMGRSQWESYAMSTDTDEPRTCERCNAPIPQARVKAIPGTWLCLECSEEVGGDFSYTATQENLGKAGSLKLNYGGIGAIKKTRKKLEPNE